MPAACALGMNSGKIILIEQCRAVCGPPGIAFSQMELGRQGADAAPASYESAARRIAGSPSQSMPIGLDSSPKGRAFGSLRKLHLFAKASPFGRGVTAGDGEGEDADHVQQPYSKNSFHGAAAGRGREKAMGLPVSGWTNCSPALCKAMSPLNRLPYLPSP